jgi:threonine dehydratase
MNLSVELSDIQAAAQRLSGRVRRTPVLPATQQKESLGAGDLFLKLESLQVTGSFKARGAVNTLLSLSDAEIKRGICTASGGNHGLAVAFAGWSAKTRALVYLPRSTPKAKAEKIRAWGAEVVIEGAVWDEADAAARARAQEEGMTYVPAFSDPRVIAGQGTLALELLQDVAELDSVVVAIGGGGLISGVATAVKALRPEIEVIGVEPVGAPTLKRSLEEGRLVTLDKIETAAGTLAPRCSADINLEIIRRTVDEIVLVSDEQMRAAARWLWFEYALGSELAGAAAVAAIQSGRVPLEKGRRVAAIVCGAGEDGIAQ